MVLRQHSTSITFLLENTIRSVTSVQKRSSEPLIHRSPFYVALYNNLAKAAVKLRGYETGDRGPVWVIVVLALKQL